MMELMVLTVGSLQANCYVVVCTNTQKAVVIDPGGDAELIINRIKERGLDLQYIINTHGHMDHVGANWQLRNALGGKLCIHQADEAMLGHSRGFGQTRQPEKSLNTPDIYLNDLDEILCGDLVFKVVHTPGHTPGGICLMLDKSLFTGDTLFSGSVGRWDFPGGSFEDLMHSIKTKLMDLDDDVVVYPGHGPASTIGTEKRYNPFLQ